MSKVHDIRILDLDAGRLMQLEAHVKSVVRKLKLKARVSMVSDNLAIARQGFMDKVPIIEIDGRIVSHSIKIQTDQLTRLFKLFE